MNIKEIKWSARNDFRAVFVCPKCGHEYEERGYSDAFFYQTVMPNAICPECGLNSLGETADELKARVGQTFRI